MFNQLEMELGFRRKGHCEPNEMLTYLLYAQDNWSQVKSFCAPFPIERTKKGKKEGRATIELPTGNEAFEYGSLLVRLGRTRILICSKKEFEELFFVI
ncbi:hypothetical protein [Enterococcus gilvus]|uniref:hypothetical protein n=1 Tax=Enterococcus gilvus TaxID=160453 RepID=UPI0028D8F82B|nr:hypothetical protein [Enterococcus gilvus]